MPKKVNGSDNRISTHKREIRRAEHEARAMARQSLTPQQQLTELNTRFGAGLGASKQRARLAKLL